jgi:hypothetical protein
MGCAVAAPMMILDREQMIRDVKTTDKSVFVYPGRLITTALLVFPTKSRWNYPRNNRGNKSEQMGYKANKKEQQAASLSLISSLRIPCSNSLCYRNRNTNRPRPEEWYKKGVLRKDNRIKTRHANCSLHLGIPRTS